MTRVLALAVFAALAALAISLTLGVRAVPASAIPEAFFAFDPQNADHVVIRELRLPRALAALLGGGALGLAGALMQTMTRNPLADPGLLGINGGASFGVVLGIWGLGLVAPGALAVPAIIGAAVAAVLVLLLGGAAGRRGPDPIRLVLAGAALSALFLALSWALLIAARQTLDVYRFWVLGGFQGIEFAQIAALAPLFAAGLVFAAIAAKMLGPLALGDDTARALGVRIGVVRLVSALAIVLLCGATVSMAGPIAFIGLLVPHLVRPLARSDTRLLALGSLATGAALALAADTLGRVILPGQEVEAGAMMALIGGPALIAFVYRRREVAL
ncbi:MAG: iron ABC transporter permease [Pseudomonadota bacterium]